MKNDSSSFEDDLGLEYYDLDGSDDSFRKTKNSAATTSTTSTTTTARSAILKYYIYL